MLRFRLIISKQVDPCNGKTKPSAMSKAALTKKPMNMPILSARAKQRFLFVKSPLKTQITA
jgi:hypothetical protein